MADEERTYYPIADSDYVSIDRVSRSIREVPPADYNLKIDSFTSLSEISLRRGLPYNYQSSSFEAGGYKWKLSLYPLGDLESNGDGHISLYLVMAEDKDATSTDFEVNVNFKLFVHDKIRDRYLTVQDADGKIRRFHKLKTQHGFSQLISHETFKDPSIGYLVENSCAFGVEVFVIKNKGKGERLSLIKDPEPFQINTWRIENFSKATDLVIKSPDIYAGGRKWRLLLCPRGDLYQDGKNLSLYLQLADCFVFPFYFKGYPIIPTYISRWIRRNNCTIYPHERKIFVECKIRVIDQKRGHHFEDTITAWFSATSPGFGRPSLVPLTDLKDKSRGFLVKDALIIEAKFKVTFAEMNLT